MAADDALTARLRQALADRDGVTEKRMFGGVCFMLRDHMLCGTGKCPEPEVRTHYAARAIANFGFKGALESIELLVSFRFRSSHRTRREMGRTSESGH